MEHSRSNLAYPVSCYTRILKLLNFNKNRTAKRFKEKKQQEREIMKAAAILKRVRLAQDNIRQLEIGDSSCNVQSASQNRIIMTPGYRQLSSSEKKQQECEMENIGQLEILDSSSNMQIASQDRMFSIMRKLELSQYKDGDGDEMGMKMQ